MCFVSRLLACNRPLNCNKVYDWHLPMVPTRNNHLGWLRQTNKSSNTYDIATANVNRCAAISIPGEDSMHGKLFRGTIQVHEMPSSATTPAQVPFQYCNTCTSSHDAFTFCHTCASPLHAFQCYNTCTSQHADCASMALQNSIINASL